ncbi:MAG: hypothetical protein HGA76_08025 [Candidatus Firestonebacteria bacterium]|nr:hypothetical protein [Candidatus Firestonebacteria bacterium]
MSIEPENPINVPAVCAVHGHPGKWVCGKCSQSLCSDCKPVAYDFRVFHPACLELESRQAEKKASHRPLETPSVGVRFLAWFFMIAAVAVFGLALLLLGVGFLSRSAMPLGALIGGGLPTIDDVPGGRTLLIWMGFLVALLAVLAVFIGVGLLNCLQAARRAILVFSWIEILLALIGWIVVLAAGRGFWDVPVFAVLMIVYFSRKDVKRQFEPAPELIEVNR